MGEMSGSLAYSPVLHAGCNDIGDIAFKCSPFLHGPFQRLIYGLGKHLPHDMVVEHHAAEQLRNLFHSSLLSHI